MSLLETNEKGLVTIASIRKHLINPTDTAKHIEALKAADRKLQRFDKLTAVHTYDPNDESTWPPKDLEYVVWLNNPNYPQRCMLLILDVNYLEKGDIYSLNIQALQTYLESLKNADR